MAASVIAIANQKGGVAKTTTTVNLGRALLELGAHVLLIDSDPQGSLSLAEGVDPRELIELDRSGKTLYFGLARDSSLEELIIRRDDRPDLIPACDSLDDAEKNIRSDFGVATVLRKKMFSLRDQYDFILIDCPPRRSFLTVNALTAANKVLIPCKTDYLSAMGITRLLQTIEEVRMHANPELEVIGVLPTIYTARAGHDNEVVVQLKRIAEAANVPVFDSIHRATAFDKSAVEGRSALELAPSTPGIHVYRQIAQALYGRVNSGETAPRIE